MNVWKISGFIVNDAYLNTNGFGHFSIDHDQLNYNKTGSVTGSSTIRINCEWPIANREVLDTLKAGLLVIAIGTPRVKKFIHGRTGALDASLAMIIRKVVPRPRGAEHSDEPDQEEESHE